MRYYGKEGPQCHLPVQERCEDGARCRKAAHALLFGRVPRGVVMWLGLGLMVTVITMGFWGLSGLSAKESHFVRDQGSAIMIRR